MKDIENPFDMLNSPLLSDVGLNMQAAFPVSSLPLELAKQMAELLGEKGRSGWLLLLGNGGRRFWEQLPVTAWDRTHPLDRQSVEYAERYLQAEFPEREYQVLYPSAAPVALQQLGKLAGWHYDSPLKLGINSVFGLWYAYRVLLWVAGDAPVTRTVALESPCKTCTDMLCIPACPASALSTVPTHQDAKYRNAKNLDACIDYRLQAESPCQSNCIARCRCPVATDHQYSQQQLNYHYRQSFETIVRWRF